MPMNDTSPALSLPLIQPSQAQKHVTHNEAIDVLDVMVQTTVLRADLSAPPGAPQTGQMYIVAAPGTGEWAGQQGALARYANGGWRFFAPRPGWRVWVLNPGVLQVYAAGGWQPVAGSGGLPTDQLGLNATADAINRLTVSAPATLLTHEGADHRLKINKANTSDTASLLFQDGYSGRAEMGLAGSDDWSIRVSQDGSTWITALQVEAATGRVSGAGVQGDRSDTVSGRLVTTQGAAAAALGHYGGDHDATVPRDIDAVPAGDVGRYSTANPGTWPVNAPAFVHVETQRLYGNAAARQIATAYLDSPGGLPRQWVRLRSINGDWSNWSGLYSQASAVGVVSQEAGLPTGALIEHGITATGRYLRFADGTQICQWRNPAEVSLAQGGVQDITWTYPAPFSAALDVAITLSPERASGSAAAVPAVCFATYRDGMTSTTAALGLTNLNGVAAFCYTLTAMGRWF